MRGIKLCVVIVLVLMFLTTCATDSNAQSTILNTPSTDVVEEKKTYVEFDFLMHPAKKINDGFQYYGWRTVYGIKKNFEVGINGTRTDLFNPEPVLEIQPNAKWQFYNNEENGMAASVGGMAFIQTNHRTETDSFGLLYMNVSKQIKGKFGPRLTGGYYNLVGLQSGSGNRSGVMIGIEQPVYKKLSFCDRLYQREQSSGFCNTCIRFYTNK